MALQKDYDNTIDGGFEQRGSFKENGNKRALSPRVRERED